MLMPTTAGSANSKGAPAPRTASPDGLHHWVPRSTVTALDLPSRTTTDQISNDLYGNVRRGTAPASVNAVDLPNRPDAPTFTENETGPTSLKVNWTLPDDNGLTITGYSIQFRKATESSWTYWYNNASDLSDTSQQNDTITTLKPDTLYEVQVRVHASNVGSPWSETGSETTDSFTASISQLFPNGDPAKLEFSGLIAGNAGSTDSTDARHVFKFKKQGETGRLTPAEALITVTGPDAQHDFTIQPIANTTPAQFQAVYGDAANSVALSGILIASNTTGLSTRLNFSLNLTYDDSAQFGPPAVYQSDNRWKIPTLQEVYEGPNAAASFNWSASQSDTAVDRRWSMAEEPDGQQATVSCNYDGATIDEVHINWPNTDHDSYLFNPVNQPTDPPSHPSGTVTVSFDNSNPDPEVGDSPLKYPDYENPHDHDEDNTYHLRVINDNDVDNELNIGCTGSAVDVTIKIKDVGAPNPPTNITGNFNAEGTEINLSWTAPTTFDDNGITVDFPHSFFNPSKYLVRYRANDSDDWSTVLESTTTPIDITSLDQTHYFVEVAAFNTEGTSEWAPITIGTLADKPDAVNTPTLDGKTQTSVSITWTIPDDNGSPLERLRVRHKKTTDSSWERSTTVQPDVTTHTFNNLDDSTSYDFKVRAINGVGRGDWSDPPLTVTTNEPIQLPEATIQAVDNSVTEGSVAEFQINLVVRQRWIDGYRDFSLMRASWVVKRQSTRIASRLR